MISPSKPALYVYNAENRLIRATVQSGNNVSVEEYKYDYAGNRIAKSSEGEYTKYLLDINGELTYVLAEMNFDNTEKCYYTRGDELISQERDGNVSVYLYDGHGSVVGLANENGKVTDTTLMTHLVIFLNLQALPRIATVIAASSLTRLWAVLFACEVYGYLYG